ncbi:MAG: SAM-dependent methyltransferase [Dermatophilaceae bacterium]
MVAVPWRVAWHEALYGPAGFYRHEPPARHYSTATHGPPGAVLAEALWRWADRLGMPAIVDIGAGRGELLTHLHAARPDRPLLGCDVIDRPGPLPQAVGWLPSPGGAALPDQLRDLTGVLVVAHEWLDVVPCDVARVDDDGTRRLVHVDPASGAESLGEPLGEQDRLWCERHWPGSAPGDRVEIGVTREDAWADLLSRVSSGAVLAVDYGHERDHRPADGTLTAYRHGAQVTPVPDGTCDLTAHVAVDALCHDRLLTQAEAFREVWPGVERADPARAGDDPRGFLLGLERSAATSELTRPDGYGGFRWVLACLPEAGPRGAADWPP